MAFSCLGVLVLLFLAALGICGGKYIYIYRRISFLNNELNKIAYRECISIVKYFANYISHNTQVYIYTTQCKLLAN